MEPRIDVEPDAWATIDQCRGPTLGNVRYAKLPIQSLNPLRYKHEKLYSEKIVIGLMKAAYYNGCSEREKAARVEITELKQQRDELLAAAKLFRAHAHLSVTDADGYAEAVAAIEKEQK